MDMESSPPWASELRAKNRRVARNISSTSALPDSIGRRPDSFLLELNKNDRDPEEYNLQGMNINTRSDLLGTTTSLKNKVDDPTPNANPPGPGPKTKQTEKLYSTSSSSTHGFYEHEPDEMDIGFEILKENYRNNTGHGSSPPSDEPSLIEYGPGIVRKLRSKYQSLALRQYPSNSSSSSGRPNLLLLRRAASLENGLDEKGLELEESELPFPRSETQSPEKIQPTTIFTRSSRPTKTSSNNKFHQNSNNRRRDENIENIEISTSVSRLRRARSVDILHTHHSQNQYEYDTESNCTRNSKSHNTAEEINEENQRILLAKFHSVVRPREEVIIIEMTHPKSNGPAPPGGPVQPELPPPDIVRHTAQLFEPKATWKKLGNGIIATNNTTCTNNQKRLNTMDNKKQKAYVLPQVQKSQSPSPIPPSSNNKQQLQIPQQPPAVVSSKQQSQPPHSPTRQIGIIRPTLQKFQGNNITGLAKPPLSPKPQNFVISSSKFQRQSPSPAPTPTSPEPIQQALKKQSILIPKEDEVPVTVSKLPFQIQLKPVSKETVSLEKMTATAPRALSPVPAPSKEIQFPIQKSIVSEESLLVPTEPKSTTKKLPIVSLLEKKEGEALKHGIKNLNNSIPSTNSTNLLPNKSQDSSSSQPPLSDLRSFQKRKSNETSSGHSNAMVFNFTKTRSKVPDYIEDDGSSGTSDVLDGTNAGTFQILQFIGANIIINGRSSLQKKPKSQKKRIQFDENGIQTFEYPSESSILNSDTEDVDSSSTGASGLLNNLVNNNGTNGGSGSSGGLGSYTPSKSSFQTTSYQLGSYAPQTSGTGGPPVFKPYQNSSNQEEPSGDDDYLKPDTGSTTWSSEIGAADILF